MSGYGFGGPTTIGAKTVTAAMLNSGAAASGAVPIADGASGAAWAALTAAQVTNAADKSTATQQTFTGAVQAPSVYVGAVDTAQFVSRGTGQAAAFIQGDSTRSASNQLVFSANRLGQTGGFQLWGDHHMTLGVAATPVTIATTGVVTEFGLATQAITSGALPTISPASTTALQVSTARDVFLMQTCTFNPSAGAAATCKVELSPDNSTYSTLITVTVPVGVVFDGGIPPISFQVPAGWWVKFTTTNATLGTGTYY